MRSIRSIVSIVARPATARDVCSHEQRPVASGQPGFGPVAALPSVIATLVAMNLPLTGSGTVRADPPTGVSGCCLPDLTCENLSRLDCIFAGGTRQPRLCTSGFCGAPETEP